MNVIDTEIPEVKIIEPKVFGDSRGYFFESWSDKRYKEAGIDCNWLQDNESRSRYGVLRGLHFRQHLTHRRNLSVSSKAQCWMWLLISEKVRPRLANMSQSN